MRYLLASVVLLTMLSSCQSEGVVSRSKEKELQTFLLEKIKTSDSTLTLDSFRFIRLDTLTLKNKLSGNLNNLLDQMDALNEEMGGIIEEMKDNYKMARLANGVSYSLFKNYRDDAEENQKEIKEKGAEFESISRQADSIKTLRDKCDSISPIGFEAVCLYQYRRKDQSVKKDTAYIFMNADKNIIEREDFYK